MQKESLEKHDLLIIRVCSTDDSNDDWDISFINISKNLMKILFVTQWTDIYPSSRFRVYNLLPHLAQHGITYTVVPINNFRFRIQDKIISSNLKYFYKLVLLINNIVKWCVVLAKSLGGEYDILFIQKPIFNFNFYPVFEKILSKINKNIVFDMDDALQLTNKHIPTILKIAKATLVENKRIGNAHLASQIA